MAMYVVTTPSRPSGRMGTAGSSTQEHVEWEIDAW